MLQLGTAGKITVQIESTKVSYRITSLVFLVNIYCLHVQQKHPCTVPYPIDNVLGFNISYLCYFMYIIMACN